MAGLNNLVSDKTTQATTLPSWMNTAQQNVVNQASIGAAGVPALQNTVAQGAINQLNSPTNPFATSQGCLLYTSPSPRDRTRSRMPSSA